MAPSESRKTHYGPDRRCLQLCVGTLTCVAVLMTLTHVGVFDRGTVLMRSLGHHTISFRPPAHSLENAATHLHNYSHARLEKQLPNMHADIAGSLHESHGFFNYNVEAWARKIRILDRRRKSVDGQKHAGLQRRSRYAFHQHARAASPEPEWSCDFEERMGGAGDGGKWVCNPFRIQEMRTPACAVISIGSNNDWSFETAVHDSIPRCDIFTFDHTLANPSPPSFVRFFRLGLGSARSNSGLRTLQEMFAVAGLGHNTSVEILKIDCEGCEWSAYPQLFEGHGMFVRQILLEVHLRPPRIPTSLSESLMTTSRAREHWTALIAKLHHVFHEGKRHGYVIFHKEHNPLCTGECFEYGLLKLNIPGLSNNYEQQTTNSSHLHTVRG
jgi:hypothetical protein